MGDRYILTVACEGCGFRDGDVFYAPTCGVVDWRCPNCGEVVDLEALTGITYEDASNLGEMQAMVEALMDHSRPRRGW
jgi:C4-type Zn-finger protein